MELSCLETQAGIDIVLLGPEYGSLEARTLWKLEQRLEAFHSDSTGLLIDCAATNYVGCGFLNALLRCHQRAHQMNWRVVICSLNPWLKEVLAIARLDSSWEIHQTRSKSIDAIQIALADGCDANRSGNIGQAGGS